MSPPVLIYLLSIMGYSFRCRCRCRPGPCFTFTALTYSLQTDRQASVARSVFCVCMVPVLCWGPRYIHAYIHTGFPGYQGRGALSCMSLLDFLFPCGFNSSLIISSGYQKRKKKKKKRTTDVEWDPCQYQAQGKRKRLMCIIIVTASQVM